MKRPALAMSWFNRDQWPLLLIWSCLVVLPIGRVVEVPALLILLVVAGVRAPAQVQRCMLSYALCLLVAFFPVNSHMAIYSSFWSQIVWWLIALYCAAYGAAMASAVPDSAVDP